jgi:hypothetical protein
MHRNAFGMSAYTGNTLAATRFGKYSDMDWLSEND